MMTSSIHLFVTGSENVQEGNGEEAQKSQCSLQGSLSSTQMRLQLRVKRTWRTSHPGMESRPYRRRSLPVQHVHENDCWHHRADAALTWRDKGRRSAEQRDCILGRGGRVRIAGQTCQQQMRHCCRPCSIEVIAVVLKPPLSRGWNSRLLETPCIWHAGGTAWAANIAELDVRTESCPAINRGTRSWILEKKKGKGIGEQE
jgi:hypothetical protein